MSPSYVYVTPNNHYGSSETLEEAIAYIRSQLPNQDQIKVFSLVMHYQNTLLKVQSKWAV